MKELKNELPPTTGGTPWYQKVKKVLTVVSQIILTAPIKLPAKVKAGAQYVAILLGILNSLEKPRADGEKEEEDSEND